MCLVHARGGVLRDQQTGAEAQAVKGSRLRLRGVAAKLVDPKEVHLRTQGHL